MADSQIPKISSTDLQSLQHHANLLHLFHHRNKNQHRRSIWWRHFSIFRKQLHLLISELTTLNQAPPTHLERTRKKAADKATRLTVSQRLSFWQNVLVSKWQNGFSQLVTDGRFAQLGLVLIAVLARVCGIVGITARLEEVAQMEVERVLEDFGREFAAQQSTTTGLGVTMEEDVGIVVARDAAEAESGPTTSALIDTEDTTERRVSSRLVKPPRKKRKKGNAIDDLFDSLD